MSKDAVNSVSIKVPDTKVIQILRALILKSVGNKQINQKKKM
jgi:hypothetical protein